MTRNLKTLGVALVAVFAIGAVVASAASAQGKLTSTGNVTLTGTETGENANRLTAFNAFVECPGSTYTGHKLAETPHKFITSGSTTATLTPKYKEAEDNCRGSLNTSATIDMNGCDYVIHLGATTGGVNGTYGITFDVVCPAGKQITVTIWLSKAAHTSEPLAPKCILHVPGVAGGVNQNLAGAHATDTGNGTIDLTGTVKGITVTQTRNSILCPVKNGNGTHDPEAEFHLDVNVTGKNEAGGATSISLSH